MKVERGGKLRKRSTPSYISISNAYASLEDFAADPGTTDNNSNNQQSNFKLKAAKQHQKRLEQNLKKHKLATTMNDNGIIDFYMYKAEDERTVMAKNDKANKKRITIDAAHAASTKSKPTIWQQGRNASQTLSTAVRRFVCSCKGDNKRVRFGSNVTATFGSRDEATMLTYDSGADGNYLSE